jgi:hypothetical protein
MKRILFYMAFIFAVCVGIVGCYKDVNIAATPVNPDSQPPQYVSYSAELAPLFNGNCAKPGCHLAGGHHPYLNTEVSYNELINGGFVNTLVPKESILYIQINSNMMQFIPNASDRQKVYDWIRNGAPNN